MPTIALIAHLGRAIIAVCSPSATPEEWGIVELKPEKRGVRWGEVQTMLTVTDKKIILAYARNNMKPGATGQELNYHYTNISYHLDRIRDKTSLNPRKFYDLIKLVKEVNGK